MNLLRDLLFDYTLRTVALGAGALGIVSGALGTFAVLRRQSLLGDAISHAALPGIVLAFLLTGSKSAAGAGAGRRARRLAGHAGGDAGGAAQPACRRTARWASCCPSSSASAWCC
jgi:hypothetical protein